MVVMQATLAKLRIWGGFGVQSCGPFSHDADVVEWPPPSCRFRQRTVDVQDLDVFRRIPGQTQLRPGDAVRDPRNFVLPIPGDVSGDRRSKGTDRGGYSIRNTGVQRIPDLPARSCPRRRIGIRRRNRGLPPPKSANATVWIDSRRHPSFRPGDHCCHIGMCGLTHAVNDWHRRRESVGDDQVGARGR